MTATNFPPPDSGMRPNDDVGKIKEVGKGPQKGLLVGAKELVDQAPPSALGVSDNYGAGAKEGSAVKEYQGLVADGVSTDEVAHVHTSAARTLRALGIDPPPQLGDTIKLYRAALGMDPAGQLDLSLVARADELEDAGGKGRGHRGLLFVGRLAAREGLELPTDLGTTEGRGRYRKRLVEFQIRIGVTPTGSLDVQTVEGAARWGTKRVKDLAREERTLTARRSHLVEVRKHTKDPAEQQRLDGEIAKIDQRLAKVKDDQTFLLGELKEVLPPEDFAALQEELNQIAKGNDGTPKDTVKISDGSKPTQTGGKPEASPPPAPVKENPKADAAPAKDKADSKKLDDAFILRWFSQMQEDDRQALRNLLDADGRAAFNKFGALGKGELAELLKNPAAMAAEINKMGIASVAADGTITLRSGISVKGSLKPVG